MKKEALLLVAIVALAMTVSFLVGGKWACSSGGGVLVQPFSCYLPESTSEGFVVPPLLPNDPNGTDWLEVLG